VQEILEQQLLIRDEVFATSFTIENVLTGRKKSCCGSHVVQNCITWCLLFLTVRSLGYWLYRKSWKFIFQITYEPRIL